MLKAKNYQGLIQGGKRSGDGREGGTMSVNGGGCLDDLHGLCWLSLSVML